MKKFLFILIFVFVLSGCSSQSDIRIGTGDVGGNYYTYGTTLAQLIEADNPDITIKVRETEGSAANLRLIDKEYVNLAFTQSDALKDTYNSNDYSAVAGLYTEACQIVTKADSGIETVADLYGKRVSLGEDESGVLSNAKQILKAYGLSEDMLEASYLSFTDSAASINNGNIDAFFCTAGAPTSAVAELARICDIKLIPIDGDVADRITKQYSGYSLYTIKAGTYKGQDEDIQTLGVKTVLVASNKISDDTVKKITEVIFNHSDDLMFATGGDTKPDINFATQDIPIPFHKGAALYYAEQGIDVTQNDKAAEKSVQEFNND